MNEQIGLRGKVWFEALTGKSTPPANGPASVLATKASLGQEEAFFLCVVPNPQSRFPCARDGQVGLEEGFGLAHHLRLLLAEDKDVPPEKKRPIIAVVDIKSQAYGRREETAGLYFAAAAASDAYATARMAGHPVIALIVGHAFSGGFLTHGYQANRILAFDDPDVVIHAMHKEASARITRRTVKALEDEASRIPPLSYDIRDYAKLGLLFKLLHVNDPMRPEASEVKTVCSSLLEAIKDARSGPRDLSVRLATPAALETRRASIAVRAKLEEQWVGVENEK